MNISAYKCADHSDKLYYGKASLKKGFAFADGDEAFYALVGNNSCYTILELLHPDDIGEFMEAVSRLGEGKQHLIVRMRCYDNLYHCLYLVLRSNGKHFENFDSFDIEFCNFMELKDRYVTYMHLVKKYREFLSLSGQSYFEYTFATDEMNIYRYVNVRSVPVLKCSLDELKDKLTASKEPDYVKSEFEVLYAALKNGTDQFDVAVTIPSYSLSASNNHKSKCRFKGRLMYKEGVRELSVGTISAIGGDEEPKSYYMTDSAFDPGTGLLNKRAINEYVIERIQECDRTHEGLYLAIVDVDDFKKINDTYGHMFGDEVLSKVSELIRNVMDTRGVAGRFGGDEFMVLFENVPTEQDLRRIMKTIAKNIQWAFQEMQESVSITTSWGIAKYPEDGTNFESLFKKADKALYIAKAKGKNRYIIYDEKKHGNVVTDKEIQQNSGIRTTLASDSRKAEIVQELTLTLYKEGKEALKIAMEEVCAYFDIDGAAIYTGEDMHRSLSVGKYINPISNLVCMQDPAYLEMFDAHGMYAESNISHLNSSYVEAFQLYERQENGKFIQFMAVREGRPAAVIAFDFFNRSPKLGVTDMGMIKIVGTLMAEIAAK